MYVCLCNALREKDVRAAARSCGARKPADVYAHLGAQVECGTCVPYARAVIVEEQRVPGQPVWPAE